jgi:hypothetical protein
VISRDWLRGQSRNCSGGLHNCYWAISWLLDIRWIGYWFRINVWNVAQDVLVCHGAWLLLPLQRFKRRRLGCKMPKSESSYIHIIIITHALSPRYSSKTPTFYQNDLAIWNTADVTGSTSYHRLTSINLRCECCWSFSRLLRHPWMKGRGAILLFCPGHHTRVIIIINSLIPLNGVSTFLVLLFVNPSFPNILEKIEKI